MLPLEKRIVLIPIDFTEITLFALDQGIKLANVIGAEITIINVIEDHGFFNKYITNKEESEFKKKLEKDLETLSKEKSAKSGVKINYMIAHGKIYEKINEVAEMLGATLVLMGTSGSMGIMKFIGSNTLRVIRESKIPVISIKGTKFQDGLSSILLPLDLTKETREKVAKAVWLSKLYGNVPIKVVSVSTSTEKTIKNKIKRQEIQVRDFLLQKGIECTTKMLGKAKGKTLAETIIGHAESVGAGMIVIMTQQETNISEMFIGSSAQAIINGSEIPVMSVVPAPKVLSGVHL
ncbi:MAG TPA: universal stress protein [Flavobacteriales bacterium]|nr:universal stress protein [Flavobacteriales bacterium]